MSDEIELVDEAEEEEFPCDECDFVSTSKGGLTRHVNAQHAEDDGPEVVAEDDEGNQYIEAPEGGLFGPDGLTNHQRTVNPSYGAERGDGLVGVDDAYPAQASRGSGDD